MWIFSFFEVNYVFIFLFLAFYCISFFCQKKETNKQKKQEKATHTQKKKGQTNEHQRASNFQKIKMGKTSKTCVVYFTVYIKKSWMVCYYTS